MEAIRLRICPWESFGRETDISPPCREKIWAPRKKVFVWTTATLSMRFRIHCLQQISKTSKKKKKRRYPWYDIKIDLTVRIGNLMVKCFNLINRTHFWPTKTFSFYSTRQKNPSEWLWVYWLHLPQTDKNFIHQKKSPRYDTKLYLRAWLQI